MRIGIDGLHLFGPYSGVQYSLARLVEALRTDFPGDEIVLYAPRDFQGPPKRESDAGLRVLRTWFPGRWRGVRTLWRNLRLQSNAYRDHCDILHGPTYTLPPMLSLPAVLTLHDTIALSHPQFATPGSARIQKKYLPRSVKSARRVIVPTEAVKAEAVPSLKLDPDRVDVVPWGVGSEFQVITDRARLEKARKDWSLPERFVLFVGTLEPKKNIEGLIGAFFAAKVHRKLPHALVFAGRMGWGMQGLEKLIQELCAREYVLFTGYVPEQALPPLYNLAELLVLPSHIEGFGMPVLEAMACGCPVVVSDAPALVEVAGGAARVCPAGAEHRHQALRETFEELLLDGAASRAELRAKGLERARQFPWSRTARLTRECYAKALTTDR